MVQNDIRLIVITKQPDAFNRMAVAQSGKTSILLRLPKAEADALRKLCKEKDISQTAFLRQLIHDKTAVASPGVVEDGGNNVSHAKHQALDSDDDRPPRQIHIRLSGAEYDLAISQAAGWRSVASWVAALVRSRLHGSAPMLSELDRIALRASNLELRRLGINLNQIAYRMNLDDRHQLELCEIETINDTLAAMDTHMTRIHAAINQTRAKPAKRRD